MTLKIAFAASSAPSAQQALAELTARYGQHPQDVADVIVALGGDGFMLQTLHATEHLPAPVYGMNRGTVGFLMNEYNAEGLPQRLAASGRETINPLLMVAHEAGGGEARALAINEVSLLRVGAQAAKLRLFVDGKLRMDHLVCDGAMVSTPAGSTAYNYSAHGPILPIGTDALTLTPVAAFRPRRWRGAILPSAAQVRFEVLEPDKRSVMAYADSAMVENVVAVDVRIERSISHHILFDPGHGLEERLISEQFT